MEIEMSKNKKSKVQTTKKVQPQPNSENNNDQKAIAAILSSYATQLIDLSKLSTEDKKKKEHDLEYVVKILADSLGAQGLLQNMLVTQLLGVYELQQKLLPYASRSIHSPEYGQYYINAISKLSNVFINQSSLLQKLQGNSQQKVVVEHMHINEGGQAIVGHVNVRKEGVANEK
jgi:hypothetical protein